VKRRTFIALLGSAAAAWPLAARAQQPDRMRRIGVLMGYAENDSEAQAWVAAFREGLQKLGWTEGRNTKIDTRWATPGDAEAMQRFAKELVALQPDLILSHTTPTTTALLQQTRTIPIISQTLAIRLAAASSPASRDLAAMSLVSTFRSRRRLASGWNCSRRLRRVLPRSRCCSTRQRRHMPTIG